MDHVTPLKAGMKWALYLSLISIALTVIPHYTGFSDITNPEDPNALTISIISLVIGLIITALAQLYFRKHNEGLMTFGEGMSVALFLGIFTGIISAIFMYFFLTYIAPDMSETMKDIALQDESMSDAEREAANSIVGAMTSPTAMAFFSFIGTIIQHTIMGILTSIFIKRA